VATEVEEVLSDLYPLLRTVQPAEINSTLNALATALEGRGERSARTSRPSTATSSGSTRRSPTSSRTCG
jgi:ABC-type transporter Mla subunit MlaD